LASTPEGKLTKRIQDYLNSLDQCLAWKIVAHPKQRIGLPDLMVIYKGKAIGLEVKTPQNKKGATVRQLYTLRQIKEAGGEAYIVRSLESVKKRFK
jgi:hypothetical protein